MAAGKKKYPPMNEWKSAPYKSKEEPYSYFVLVKPYASDLEDVVIGEDGREYVKTDRIPINLDEIPEYQRRELARATLEMVQRFYERPGAKEAFEKWKAERDARKLMEIKAAKETVKSNADEPENEPQDAPQTAK